MAGVFLQGFEQGGAVFNRLEGCWWGEGSLYFHDTRGGAAGEGHVWRYTPGHDDDDERRGGGLRGLTMAITGPWRRGAL